jgi:hypothetical protein
MSRRITLVALLVLTLVVVSVSSVLAQATTSKQVGLVISFPNGSEHLEIVTVPSAATTFDVLKAAKINLVSQLGSYGQAICSINGTGCPATNCFCDAQHYWAYYHLDGANWAVAPSGRLCMERFRRAI